MATVQQIQKIAKDLGIEAVGVIPCGEVEPSQVESFRHYLQCGFQGDMSYLERNLDKRFAPAQLFPGTRSIIVTLCRYVPRADAQPDPHKARFAQGEDYHITTKNLLHELATALQLQPKTYRCFCDTAPLLDKYWAAKAGLGVIGRNSLLLNPVSGSFCSIGIILSQEEFASYSPVIATKDFQPDGGNPLHPCNNCRTCIDACPTGALDTAQGVHLNARKCNSYLTVEKRGEPVGSTPYTFGCDICQNVCPANRHLLH